MPPRTPPTGLATAVLIRSASLTAGYMVCLRLLPRLMPDDDGLGAGLTFLTLLAAGTTTWGVLDAVRRPAWFSATVWAGTAVVASWAMGHAPVLVFGRADADVSDIDGFLAGLIAGTALVSIGLVSVAAWWDARRSRAAQTRATQR